LRADGLPALPMIVPASLFGINILKVFCRREENQTEKTVKTVCLGSQDR
jgi:hypothetical protein